MWPLNRLYVLTHEDKNYWEIICGETNGENNNGGNIENGRRLAGHSIENRSFSAIGAQGDPRTNQPGNEER